MKQVWNCPSTPSRQRWLRSQSLERFSLSAAPSARRSTSSARTSVQANREKVEEWRAAGDSFGSSVPVFSKPCVYGRAMISPKASKPMINKFLHDETGLELSEYAVAAA